MWSLYILVIGFVIVYFLAYILKCILDYKKLKEMLVFSPYLLVFLSF